MGVAGVKDLGLGLLYRCEAKRYSYIIDADLDMYGTTPPRLEFREYPIIKRTPKGAWIDIYGKKRFVLLTARKKFACDTREDAIRSFIARKERQIRILNRQLYDAREDMALGWSHLDQSQKGDE